MITTVARVGLPYEEKGYQGTFCEFTLWGVVVVVVSKTWYVEQDSAGNLLPGWRSGGVSLGGSRLIASLLAC